MQNTIPTEERIRQAANALIVVDVNDNPTEARWKLAERIHKFIVEHNDEYKVIIATQRTDREKFSPALTGPDLYGTNDNTDFDSIFVGGTFDKRVNHRHEDLVTYLRTHGIGHVDIVGVDVGIEADDEFVFVNFGPVVNEYSFSTLSEMCQPYDLRSR